MSTAALRVPESDVFPMLSEMGVRRFHEISHYSLRQEGVNNDVLKIHYRRRKGSLLPVGRKYTFGRSMQTVVADGGSSRMADTWEISPCLLDAIDELDRLVARNRLAPAGEARGVANAKSALVTDLDTLRVRYAERLPEEDAADFAAAVSSLSRRIEAL